MDRPKCPQCGQAATKVGKTNAGTQRWGCTPCRLRWVESGSRGRPKGRKPPLTPAERQQRYRDKQKEQNQ